MNRHPGGEEQTLHLLEHIELRQGMTALDLGAGEGAVSYTHLDVYKRQNLDGSSSSIVFYSARGMERLKDLTGKGADHDSCGTHKPEDQ